MKCFLELIMMIKINKWNYITPITLQYSPPPSPEERSCSSTENSPTPTPRGPYKRSPRRVGTAWWSGADGGRRICESDPSSWLPDAVVGAGCRGCRSRWIVLWRAWRDRCSSAWPWRGWYPADKRHTRGRRRQAGGFYAVDRNGIFLPRWKFDSELFVRPFHDTEGSHIRRLEWAAYSIYPHPNIWTIGWILWYVNFFVSTVVVSPRKWIKIDLVHAICELTNEVMTRRARIPIYCDFWKK